MDRNYQLKTPFGKIALSLSGGGYRAAAFHLGSMAYLHKAKYNGVSLLENVKIISTVSGGTITGVFYAYRIKEGDTFPEICKKLFALMSPGNEDPSGKVDLLKEPLELLRNEEEWDEENAHKRRNLINAIALVYDKKITKGATFIRLWTKRRSK